MLERLYPDIYVSSIADIPLGELKKRGIKALAFDIDNKPDQCRAQNAHK